VSGRVSGLCHASIAGSRCEEKNSKIASSLHEKQRGKWEKRSLVARKGKKTPLNRELRLHTLFSWEENKRLFQRDPEPCETSSSKKPRKRLKKMHRYPKAGSEKYSQARREKGD